MNSDVGNLTIWLGNQDSDVYHGSVPVLARVKDLETRSQPDYYLPEFSNAWGEFERPMFRRRFGRGDRERTRPARATIENYRFGPAMRSKIYQEFQSYMDSMIQQKHSSNADAYHSQYDTAKPFRHMVMDDFFTVEFANQLLDRFPPFDTALAMNENGEIGAKCVHEKLPELAEPYQELDRLIQSREFLGWLEKVSGIDELIYDPHYFGGGTHENRHGQDLDPHVDFNKHPKSGLHRRLNLIVYLNQEWDDDWGGAIEFHKNPRLAPEENEIEVVAPKFNRAVLFETTHWSWHGFERIDLPGGDADPRSRKSVALYFYSKTRPPEEQTKPHSTIYVERPLPSHIRPGEKLDDADFQRIRGLLTRRDLHLQRLYNNISDLTAHVEDLIVQRDRAMAMVRELSGQEISDQEANSGTADESQGPQASPGLLRRARRWLGRRLLQ